MWMQEYFSTRKSNIKLQMKRLKIKAVHFNKLDPFDRKGGLGRFYEVFGEEYEAILMEMNIELVA